MTVQALPKPRSRKAVTVRSEAATAPAILSDSAALLQVIERAARDPNVDIDKMRQLLEMREKIATQAAERGFNDAMALAQKEMRPVAADADNSQTKSKYASYAALDRALRPIYTKHGFALSFNTAPGAPEGQVRIVCDVTNCGYTRPYQIDMPADGKGAKGGDVMTKTHATGSAVSYGMRYLLKMIFNIAVGEADDDGNAAGAVKITESQVEQIQSLIVDSGADIRKFCAYMATVAKAPVEQITDIPARHFQAAVAALEAKMRAQL